MRGPGGLVGLMFKWLVCEAKLARDSPVAQREGGQQTARFQRHLLDILWREKSCLEFLHFRLWLSVQ